MTSKSTAPSLRLASCAGGAVFLAVDGIGDFVPGATRILSSKLPRKLAQRPTSHGGRLENHPGDLLEHVVGAVQGCQNVHLEGGAQVLRHHQRGEDAAAQR